MRHVLIDSAENWKYKPFAESCIVKLKNLGASYAAQSYEVDGVSIKVRIEPNHEYIKIAGGGCELRMDSGAVTFGGTGPLSIWKDDPAYLFDVATSSAYHSAFTYETPSSKHKTNLATTREGQLAGYLTISDSSAKGEIFVDRDLPPWFPNMAGPTPANCLSPAWKEVTSPEGVVTYEPLGASTSDPEQFEDTALYLKKALVNSRPSSIFTGRTRLYVQAMYGLPLWRYSSNTRGGPKVLKPKDELIQRLSAYEGSGTPALLVKAYVGVNDINPDTNEPNAYPDVLLTTSHGVRLDPSTGKHFLITISGPLNAPSVLAYPLVSSVCGEKLRRYLITAGDEVPRYPLNDVDREHLEAYILAWSLPDVKNKFGTLVAGALGGWSMGYGWHWNWSGTQAVIVTSSPHFPEGDVNSLNGYMKSSHYEVDVTIDANAGAISSSPRTVTSEAEWRVPRAWYPIAEPDWETGYLFKITPQSALTLNTCHAPFYAFFRKDELVLCTITGTLHAAYPGWRQMSDGYASSYTPGADDVTRNTYGENSGFLNQILPAGEYMTYVFSAGGYATDNMEMSTGREGDGSETRNKVRGTRHLLFNGSFYPDGTHFLKLVGDPPLPRWVTGSSTVYDYGYLHTWDRETYELAEYINTGAEICVPFNDSEAIYISTNRSRLLRKHNRVSYQNTTGAILWLFEQVASAAENSPGGSSGSYGLDFTWGQGFDYDTSTALADSEETTTTSTDVLVDRYAVRTHAPVTTGYQFWHVNTEDYVESAYDTRSAASHRSAVIYSAQCNVIVGTDAWFATTVGWA